MTPGARRVRVQQPVTAFAAEPTTSPVMFAALANGLWKSADGGVSWQPVP